jgi:hypothetical protein
MVCALRLIVPAKMKLSSLANCPNTILESKNDSLPKHEA